MTIERVSRIHSRGERGAMMIELIIAISVLSILTTIAITGFVQERRALRATYYRAVAIEVVDGEMEVLAAGRGIGIAEGSRDYESRAESARNLPPGRLVVTRKGRRLRLEWTPARKGMGGPVAREAEIR